MRKNDILILTGFCLFFLVMSVFYFMISFAGNDDKVNPIAPFMPFVVLSGFFIFLIAAFIIALTIFKIIEKKYS
jgi:fucose 4-O-acetylase-like acetyltransferase